MPSNLTLRIIEALILGGVVIALTIPLFTSSDSENTESHLPASQPGQGFAGLKLIKPVMQMGLVHHQN